MSKLADLLKKKTAAPAAAIAKEEAATEADSPAATPSTSVAYMRVLKDYSLLME